MTATVSPTSPTDTESLATEYAPQPEKRPYKSATFQGGKIHAWSSVTGIKCNQRFTSKWHIIEKNVPVTCAHCRKVLAAEGFYK